MLQLCAFLLFLYVLLLLVYGIGWFWQKEFHLPIGYTPKIKVSVVVAARNEADNIERCIRSIMAQDYPKGLLELIVVDDCSTDSTAAIVSSLNFEPLKLIRLADYIDPTEEIVSYKKRALAEGIAQSTGALIVTTDADCWMEPQWLLHMLSFYEARQAKMIVAPVAFSNDGSLLQLFQSIDFTTMQGITVATVGFNLGIMCNGANLAFEREAFFSVNGYDGVDHLVSGDDYLLQMKLKDKYPKGVHYLKSRAAIVSTLPQFTWNGFLQQRIRWASKTGKYHDPKMTLILSLVYLLNVALVLCCLLSILKPEYFRFLCLLLTAKTLIELIFLLPVTRFYKSSRQLIFFPLLQPVHICYIVVAGFLSRMGKFVWKTRTNQLTTKQKTDSNA